MNRVRQHDDEGFSLVEAVVSMVILAVVLAVVATILIGALGVTRGNAQRVTASALAAKQIEAARSQRALDIVAGAYNVTQNGTTFTVSQSANYLSQGSTSSVCTGTGNSLAYKLVSVVVTWPNMGSIKPVRSDTLRSLGLGKDGLDATKGAAAVLVQDAQGNGQPNVTVTIASGNTQTTDSNGCALFVGLIPSTYTVSLNQSGYVGINGSQQASASVGVTASTVQRVSLNYDLASGLSVSLTAPTGYAVPTALPVTLSNSLLTGGQQVFPDCSTVSTAPVGCVSGSPRLAASIFPGNATYPYSAWAGSCLDAKPANGGSSAIVTPGATAAVASALAPVNVQVRLLNLLPLSGQIIYAKHVSSTGCQSGVVITLPSAGASDFKVAIPLGTWTFSTLATGTTGTTMALTSTSSAPTATVQAGT